MSAFRKAGKKQGTVVIQSNVKRRRVDSKQNNKYNASIILKPRHAVAIDGKKLYIQEVMTPAPSTSALNLTSQFSFIVENDAVGLVEDAVLRFQVTLNNTANKLMPVPLWFDRIEWYDRHSGQEIARYHGDMMHWLCATMPRDILEVMADPCNFDAKTLRESDCTHQVGETRNYYLALPHVWLEGFDLDLSLLRGDLEIKFYPKGDWRQDATVGAVSDLVLNEIRWIAGSEMFTSRARSTFKTMKMSKAEQHNYIDIQQYTDSGRVLAAGTEYTIDLDQFHHESAMLMFTLRLSAENSDAFVYAELGPRGTIDHENVHGRSLLGDGTPIDETYCRRFIASRVFPHNFVKYNAVYIVPFTNDPLAVFRGEVDGWHQFRGDRERIRIVTGAAGTNCSYDITIDAVATAGTFAFSYKGARTAPLAFNATTAVLKAAVDALPTVKADDFQVDFSTTFDAATQVNLTLTKRNGFPFERKGGAILDMDIRATTGPTEVTYAQVVDTEGIPGFVAGTYRIDVYSVYYRQIQSYNGRLEMEDI